MTVDAQDARRHRMPAQEVAIDEQLARALLAEQHPDLAELPIERAANGWDNVMFRLGEDLALRLPRRISGAWLIVTEQRWLPRLSPHLPVATPAPLRTGEPGCGYPWRWSVTPWIPGLAAEQSPLDSSQAPRMGEFLRALHRPAPEDAPYNPHRSIPLAERAKTSEPALMRLAAERPDIVDAAILSAWEAAKATTIDLPPGWIHGDLHARNVISEAGRLAGVIDWGDMARGDPATDLHGLWMLFPDPVARGVALEAYGGISEATRRRTLGWAIAIGAVIVEAGARGDPGLSAMGETALRAVRAEL